MYKDSFLNILVVGNGSREHAIAWKLSQSSLVENIYVAPGNPGTAQIATNLSLEQFLELKDYAKQNGFFTMCTAFDEPSVDRILEMAKSGNGASSNP